MTFRAFRDTGYFVSSNGLVRSPTGRILRPRRRNNGYLRAQLGADNEQYVHRMVLIAFRGEPPPGHEADHQNKVRDDNRLRNLRWLEKSANLAQRTFPIGEDNKQAKVAERDVLIIRGGPFFRGRDILLARQLGISREQVRDIRLGKNWKHVGAQA